MHRFTAQYQRKPYSTSVDFIPAVRSKKCPVCGVSVKFENLERHVRNQHPRTNLSDDQILSTAERRQVKGASATPHRGMTPAGKRVIAVVSVVLILVLAFLILNPQGSTPGGPTLVGRPAPDFSLSTSDGGTVRLSSLLQQGRPVFLEFMDVDCSHCINEARFILPALYGNYSSRVAFLSLDADITGATDTAARINAFRTQYATPWTYALYDPGVVSAYQVSGTPTMYVLDRNGNVADAFVGETDYATLAAALDEALA